MHISALLLSIATIARAWNVQKSDLELPSNAAAKAQEAINLFTSAYADYRKYAWGHDSLAPINKTFIDDRNGWGATIVDAMSTMKIMGLEELFAEAVDFSSKIDFNRSKTSDNVSLFETTIRYLGGLISAYELGGRKDQALVDRARDVGNKLSNGWQGSNDFPYNNLNFTTDIPVIEESGIAVAGTLILEWAKLTEYTGNKTYLELAEKSMRRIGMNDSPLPGLPAQGIDPSTGKPVGDYITATGIGPEVFAYIGLDGNYTGVSPTASDLEFYQKNGFYVYNNYAYYDLRPEVLESNFYAWRATGNIKYFDRAVSGLESIKKYCTPGVGVAGINDVRSQNSTYIDHTESFFFAEVIKYIYLTFDEPEKYSLDKYVFNTEAHPFEAPDPIQSFKPPQRAQTGGHLPSKPWDGQVPQISNAPGVQKKLSDIIEQVLGL
ncbi:putative mannosyl-oligosaccharide alpha-1,2-mannosidase 1B OS=Neosartorya fumigata (strain CEA10 / CBS 144,89 / FGSC A1163) GN=mns1B PE=3 SV=1 [Rhizoctonia solani AG-1 IB]|uniref:alpha-1,2-Mannosidase n=1 Tax=Thanatephorus cucumeris (strain AG1-IB / isolate 7/3/14) TaxID=1108050 RepID=A0A0B7FT77_THACB|nr:putative mannosyl-oligosaccharide alpha-1,2-mannosidase 1B OS=Neosartorya fumigata (strain CEA10 / CBS 144,89 / FGSC A1163) GN=mns1B PE=3 SV=1 [Rhizoctonia solani AG-1 IB]